ncbi:MAG: hypothetical protein KBA61_19830, partial [Spirochaetes bacterium]|nr:hypothetical protein [Spirochaetota bacterium]
RSSFFVCFAFDDDFFAGDRLKFLATYTLYDDGNDMLSYFLLASIPVASAAGGLYGYVTTNEPACCGSTEGGLSVIAPRLAVLPVKTSEYSERIYVLELARFYF